MGQLGDEPVLGAHLQGGLNDLDGQVGAEPVVAHTLSELFKPASYGRLEVSRATSICTLDSIEQAVYEHFQE